jgi:hypothetical protein
MFNITLWILDVEFSVIEINKLCIYRYVMSNKGAGWPGSIIFALVILIHSKSNLTEKGGFQFQNRIKWNLIYS